MKLFAALLILGTYAACLYVRALVERAGRRWDAAEWRGMHGRLGARKWRGK